MRAWLHLPAKVPRHAGLAAWALLSLAVAGHGLSLRAEGPADFERAAGAIAAGDSPDHVVVLSTSLRGLAVPLVLSLREAGVAEARVVRARIEELPELLQRLGDGGTREVSLVHLDIPYRPRGTGWTRAKLQAVASTVRARGWRVRWNPRGTAERPSGAEGRLLGIHGPLRAAYFPD